MELQNADKHTFSDDAHDKIFLIWHYRHVHLKQQYCSYFKINSHIIFGKISSEFKSLISRPEVAFCRDTVSRGYPIPRKNFEPERGILRFSGFWDSGFFRDFKIPIPFPRTSVIFTQNKNEYGIPKISSRVAGIPEARLCSSRKITWPKFSSQVWQTKWSINYAMSVWSGEKIWEEFNCTW